jgi:hypothetical protein
MVSNMEYGVKYGIWCQIWNMVSNMEYGVKYGIWCQIWCQMVDYSG